MRILLADDRDQVRFGLRVLLERQPDYEVVGEAKSVEELEARVEALHPDIILVDWELPSRAGAELRTRLRALRPGSAVIALSGRIEARREAQAAGVDAFVSKGEPPEGLMAAIRACGLQVGGGQTVTSGDRHPETGRG